MMDNMLYIVPYTAQHGEFILSQQMNHKILQADAEYIKIQGNAKNLEQDNLSFTGIVNDKPIFSAGYKIFWGSVAECWFIATKEMSNYSLSVAKIIKKDFAKIAKKHNLKRVQTAVRKDFIEGQKFAEWLGLEKEGLMRKWGFDGSDQYMYARLF